MKCEEIQMVLIDYLDNMLGESEHRKIEKHLETCEKCNDELEQLHEIMHSIDNQKNKLPNESLRENFNSMLQSEIDKLKTKIKPENNFRKNSWTFKLSSPLLKIAAGFIILITGVVIGMNLKPGINDNQSAQLTELKNEVKEMKEMVMFTMLKEESPSQRIQAVGYVDEIPNPNQKVINALINTLSNDKNVNVRLAAAYSLVKFSDNPLVNEAFVSALENESEPILQIVLINILTDKKDSRALKSMQKIITNPSTIKEVKDIAEKSVKVLL